MGRGIGYDHDALYLCMKILKINKSCLYLGIYILLADINKEISEACSM